MKKILKWLLSKESYPDFNKRIHRMCDECKGMGIDTLAGSCKECHGVGFVRIIPE